LASGPILAELAKRESDMQLSFKPFDGRSWDVIDVLDEDSNRIIGRIAPKSSTISPGIRISLFDRKYEASVSTYEECLGFVRGVQAVLNRMTSVDDGRPELEHEFYKMKEAQDAPWPAPKIIE
jgi:hypothetical protein